MQHHPIAPSSMRPSIVQPKKKTVKIVKRIRKRDSAADAAMPQQPAAELTDIAAGHAASLHATTSTPQQDGATTTPQPQSAGSASPDLPPANGQSSTSVAMPGNDTSQNHGGAVAATPFAADHASAHDEAELTSPPQLQSDRNALQSGVLERSEQPVCHDADHTIDSDSGCTAAAAQVSCADHRDSAGDQVADDGESHHDSMADRKAGEHEYSAAAEARAHSAAEAHNQHHLQADHVADPDTAATASAAAADTSPVGSGSGEVPALNCIDARDRALEAGSSCADARSSNASHASSAAEHDKGACNLFDSQQGESGSDHAAVTGNSPTHTDRAATDTDFAQEAHSDPGSLPCRPEDQADTGSEHQSDDSDAAVHDAAAGNMPEHSDETESLQADTGQAAAVKLALEATQAAADGQHVLHAAGNEAAPATDGSLQLSVRIAGLQQPLVFRLDAAAHAQADAASSPARSAHASAAADHPAPRTALMHAAASNSTGQV